MAHRLNTLFQVALIVAFCAISACGRVSVNGPVIVSAGSSTESVSTVNGSVTVEDGARVADAMTVNGAVTLGSKVTADSVKTVNGAVRLGENTTVHKDVLTVNGAIDLQTGADVGGGVINVNGRIRLLAARVGGTITTVNGDIDVGRGSHVVGGITVKRPEGNWVNDVPRIVIGPEAVVEGPMVFERPVKLYVSETARVGQIDGASPEMFAGDAPAS